MTHFKEFQLFKIILDFIRFAKELEFQIKTGYTLTDSRILACFTKKELPQQGIFTYEGTVFSWRIHGLGITYHFNNRRFHYNMNAPNAGSVTFHAQTLNDFITDFQQKVDFKPEETEILLQHLCHRMLLQKIWQGYEVYSLA